MFLLIKMGSVGFEPTFSRSQTEDHNKLDQLPNSPTRIRTEVSWFLQSPDCCWIKLPKPAVIVRYTMGL